ncbi:N-acetyltransferase domain-containing protein [Favolaschia claudopus]|uniref:N-acetyltransferase domain-containing protein n=1 Tax=Favolaschia claudopus TaxID=2862362 RepID=A0AAW0DQD1_9AGAR
MTSTTTPTDPLAGMVDKFTVDSAELRKEISTHTPIRFTDVGEPYLPLPAPFERFFLSPERVSDIPDDQALMNDIRVVRTIAGPPFPLPLIASQRWLVRERAEIIKLFEQFAKGVFRPAACNPFFVLRERQADTGKEIYVGQVTVGFDEGPEKRRTPINSAWEEWRNHRVWQIGAALRPEYHRQGIATAAVGVAMNEWAIPQMGCTEIKAECFASNTGSMKLWVKFGFVEDPELRGEMTIPEAKGGGVEQERAFIWNLK